MKERLNKIIDTYIEKIEEHMNNLTQIDKQPFALAIKAIKYAFKYRWHDATKELPTEKGRYEIIYKTSIHVELQRDFSDFDLKYGFHRTPNNCVIVWRLIDEYEERIIKEC